ncbi:putative ribonuclease H-like domain-containing protein, partial [Tanacetum coccineum]
DVGNGEPKSAADDQKQVEDGPDNENDEKDKSEDNNSPKEVNIAGQHVNTASPEVTTVRFKLNTVDPSINTASSSDTDSPKDMFIMGATHVEFFSDEDEPEVDLGNILNSYTIEPTSIAKALFDSSWVEAMQEELLQFKLQQCIIIGTIKEEVYVTATTDIKDPDNPDKVYKVVKALYGLHQAPRAWYETLANYLLGNGFKRGKIDQTLFIKKQKGDILLFYGLRGCPKGVGDEWERAATHCFYLNKQSRKVVTSIRPNPWQHLMDQVLRELVQSNDPPLSRGYTLGSGEDSMKLLELMANCIKLCEKEIIDFLNANQIHYALTVNPTIYTSCIEQFWATTKAKTVNGERQLQALVDKKKVIIMETSIRSDLHLEDAGGTDCLPTATIFEELARMGYEKPSQNNKSSIHTITQC